MSTPIRRIPLAGTPNFRDLGGYETADGRTVKWRRIYRSGTLAELTDDDHIQLNDLNLGRIYDLRTDDEREKYPSRLPAGPQVVSLAIHGRDIVREEEFDLEAYLRSLTSQDLANGIQESYRIFVTRFAHQYKALFDHLETQGDDAGLIHCAAGKDRTGVACALVLHVLGVPRDTILEDYTLTNQFLDQDYRTNRKAQLIPDGIEIDVDLEDTLFDARHDYIQAAFDAIDSDFGSLDAYLTDALGVTADRKSRLQAAFLD